MKTLNEYIKESLLDDEDDLANDNTALIEQFLKDNYDIKGTYDINNGIVNVSGSIFVKNNKLKHLTNGLFKFGKISDIFSCYRCDVENLDGAPKEVGGIFICAESIKTLKGGPKKTGKFICSHCENLTSLEGAPKEVGGDFDCNTCNKLKNLTGSPQIVKGNFNCRRCNRLETLEGLPKEVGKNFYCDLCRELDSAQLAYKVTKGNVYS